MSQSVLRAQDLCVGYGSTCVVREITFGVEPGEILTLIGGNGAGKSTILKCVSGQLAPLAGQVLLDGESIMCLPKSALARKLSVVLTERIQGDWMTCEEVVAAGRYPYTGRLGVLSEADRRKVWQVMETVGIASLAARDFPTLSDGQKQLTMLARALCQEPEVLVLDEPTSYLDIRYKLELLSILQRMAREERLTVIMSLHELELAERVSDKLLCIKGGRVHRYGSPEEIFTPGYPQELFDMRAGSCDASGGRPELPKAEGVPQVFVIAGGGSGTPVYRRLQRQGIPFATGILTENDLDFPVARDLAAEVFSVQAFASAGEDVLQDALRAMESCGRVLCGAEPSGGWNQANRRLLERARELGRLV